MQHTVLRESVVETTGKHGGKLQAEFLTFLGEYEITAERTDHEGEYQSVIISPENMKVWALALLAHTERKVRTPGTVSE